MRASSVRWVGPQISSSISARCSRERWDVSRTRRVARHWDRTPVCRAVNVWGIWVTQTREVDTNPAPACGLTRNAAPTWLGTPRPRRSARMHCRASSARVASSRATVSRACVAVIAFFTASSSPSRSTHWACTTPGTPAGVSVAPGKIISARARRTARTPATSTAPPGAGAPDVSAPPGSTDPPGKPAPSPGSTGPPSSLGSPPGSDRPGSLDPVPGSTDRAGCSPARSGTPPVRVMSSTYRTPVRTARRIDPLCQ